MKKLMIVFLMFPLILSAQYTFQEVGGIDKFSQSVILAMEEDKDGFMWFGTADGLNRFDGTNVKIFRNIPDDRNCLCDNEVMALEMDNDNNLWIGNAACLNKLNLNTYQFTSYFLSKKEDLTQSENYISALFFDGKNLWIGSANGLKKMNPTTGEIKAYPKGGSPENRQEVHTISARNEGGIWVSYEDDVCYYSPKEDKLLSLSTDFSNPDLFKNQAINCLLDKEGELIIATESGVLSVDTKNNTSTKILSNEFATTRSIEKGFDDEIMIGSSLGLMKYLSEEKKIIRGRNNQLPTDVVYDIFMDSQENLWVSIGKGLIKASKKGNVIQHIKISVTDIGFSESNKVWHICDEEENVIISTAIEAYVLTPDGAIMPLIDKTKFKDIPRNVSNVIRTSKGKVWLSTFDQGVYQYDMHSKSLQHYNYNPNNPQSIPSNTIRQGLELSNGEIYFATDNGLCKYDAQQNNFKRLDILKTATAPLQKMITSIHEDVENNLWIGTKLGLFFYNPTTETSKIYHTASQPSISNNRIRDLRQTSENILWIGTSAGLNKLDIKNNIITKYYTQEGLPNDVIYSIEEDNDGDIWVGTNKGISVFVQEKYFLNFNIHDGLQGNEFNTNASLRDASGNLYFGGLNGINKFDPIQLKNYDPQHNPIFTSLKLLPKDDFEGETLEAPLEKQYQFSHLKCNFEVHFSAINFDNPENTQFYYMLEGYNHEWIKVTGEPKAEFMNLPPKQYKLKVATANRRGEVTDKIATLDIKFVPPIYKSRWFILLAILLFVLSAVGFFFWYTTRIKRRNRKLNQQVEEQTAKIKAVTIRTKNYLDSIPDAFMVVDRNFDINYGNSLLKKNSQEVHSFTWLTNLGDFSPNDKDVEYHQTILSQVKKVFTIHQEVEFEIAIMDNNDIPVFYSVRLKPIFDENKETEKCVVLFRDITLVKQTEKAARLTQQQLIQSDKMASLGQLTAGVAHEINNPVNFISNGVKGLKKTLQEYIKTPKNEPTDELVEDMNAMIVAIEEGAKRTNTIVKSLRQFSREDTEHYIEADIITGLESTFTLLSNKLKHGVFLEKDFENEAMPIFCFPGQLNQVFMNILLNAVQAVGNSGTIKVSVKEQEKNVTISISDNGVGIPDDKKQKIFEPFYTTKSIQEGTGLGLSISFGIIKKHKGEIKVKDNHPKGTRFIIQLPKKDSSLIGNR